MDNEKCYNKKDLLSDKEDENMRWLVISDLHFNFKNYNTLVLRERLLKYLQKECDKEGALSFILITGDCMFQYTRCDEDVKFITDIGKVCGVDAKNMFICPGNHDLCRSIDVRNTAIDQIRKNNEIEKFSYADNDMAYDRFDNFYYEVKNEHYKHYAVYKPENEDVCVINVDSCIFSKDKFDVGNLRVCTSELYELKGNIPKDNSLKIVIMHHGVEWLQPEDRMQFFHWLADTHIDLLYCGHNHVAGVNTLDETMYDEDEEKRKPVKQFTCGACLFDYGILPSFYICELKETETLRLVETTLHTYQNKMKWNIDFNALRTFSNSINEYVLNSRMRVMDDEFYMEKYKNEEGVKQFADKIYENIYDAHEDIAIDIRNSGFLKFFGLRGGTFEKETSKVADAMHDTKNLEIKLLLSYPYCNEIEERLKRVPDFQAADKREKQWQDIYLKARILKDELIMKENATIKFHKLPLIYRLIITQNHLYMSFYENKNSSKSRLYRFDNGTSFYKGFKRYFSYAWKNALSDYPEEIPPMYSFLKRDFSVVPSLVINITDSCNMGCSYCPDGGENLKICDKYCDISSIYVLLEAFKDECIQINHQERLVLRITGGEPMLEKEKLCKILEHARELKFQKIVLCTNGILLKEVFEEQFSIWESIKDILLLKISLDTLNQDHFRKITKTNAKILEKIIENIHYANKRGFKIELNTVSTSINVNDIIEIYEFARAIGIIGVKVLTVNDFGDRIIPDDTSEELFKLSKEMKDRGYSEKEAYLNDNKGIQMKKYFDEKGCTLTIVDHNNTANSLTPTRTYSRMCKDCSYYPKSQAIKRGEIKRPCATGIMSLTMRADGAISFCRLREDVEVNISEKSIDEIRNIVHSKMKAYRSCYHFTNDKKVGENEKIL